VISPEVAHEELIRERISNLTTALMTAVARYGAEANPIEDRANHLSNVLIAMIK